MNQADVTFTGHICISHYNCGINPCSNASVMALFLVGKLICRVAGDDDDDDDDPNIHYSWYK